jgi:hypothetical protein
MARIDEHTVVVDAGPLIHLDELDCLDLLGDCQPLVVPEAVWIEVRRHRPILEYASIKGFQILPVMGLPSPQLVTDRSI